MDATVNYFTQLLDDNGYYKFQNEVAHAMYDSLGQGYASNDNEVALVTRLVNATNGLNYKGIRLHSQKIHGAKSYVQFKHQDKPVTRELGDAVFITVVTRQRKRLLQRVCFVQHKLAKDQTWALDDAQLFLLKNFPLISGTQGLFRGAKELVFRNHSRLLGCYGLFHEPGEMVFVSAPLLTELASGHSSIELASISQPSASGIFQVASGFPFGLPAFLWHPMLKDFFHDYMHFVGKYGLWWHLASPANGMPFLGNTAFVRDLHEYARHWTLCNIGEFSYAFGATLDPQLEKVAASLLMAVGAHEFFDINQDVPEANIGIAVFVAHINVGE